MKIKEFRAIFQRKICLVGPSWPPETHGFFANKLLVVWKGFESKSPMYMVKSIAV